MISLRKGYYGGTHRLFPPDVTLARLERHLCEIGVTRCADITGLDRIGIPVFCAIRPRGGMIQVTNGKGLGRLDARVSALMEAFELFHAETLAQPPLRASFRSMRGSGQIAVDPRTLPHFSPDTYFTDEFVLEWIKGEDLPARRETWLPASAVCFFSRPKLYDTSSNGLASGNELTEATLHALYELIERDAISQLVINGRIQLDPQRCKCVDLASVCEGPLAFLIETLAKADIDTRLFWVKSCIPVHTFWTVFLDRNPFAQCSTVNIGYGTHLSPVVAAIRAITEAAQSRLTYIHGAREDLHVSNYSSGDSQAKLFSFFEGFEGVAKWKSFADRYSDDLGQDYNYVLESLFDAKYNKIYRVNLTRPPFDLAVVKVIVPGLQFNDRLF